MERYQNSLKIQRVCSHQENEDKGGFGGGWSVYCPGGRAKGLGHIPKPTPSGLIPLSAHQFSPAPSQGWQTRQWAQLTNPPIPSVLALRSPYS